MEGFDPSTMSYLADPMSLQDVTGPDQKLAVPMLALDQLDQRSTYGVDTFAG